MAADHHTDEAAELQAEEDARQRQAENPLAAEPADVPGISEEELQERLAEAGASCPIGGCNGPMCASSALATRYAKILRQERLLAMAGSALERMEEWMENQPFLPEEVSRAKTALIERSDAVRRQIKAEKGNP